MPVSELDFASGRVGERGLGRGRRNAELRPSGMALIPNVREVGDSFWKEPCTWNHSREEMEGDHVLLKGGGGASTPGFVTDSWRIKCTGSELTAKESRLQL